MRPTTAAQWAVVDAEWDAAAPAKRTIDLDAEYAEWEIDLLFGTPGKETFYDPITGENVAFDDDSVTVTDFLTGVTTITPFAPRRRLTL
jgi:hypothetical protein